MKKLIVFGYSTLNTTAYQLAKCLLAPSKSAMQRCSVYSNTMFRTTHKATVICSCSDAFFETSTRPPVILREEVPYCAELTCLTILYHVVDGPKGTRCQDYTRRLTEPDRDSCHTGGSSFWSSSYAGRTWSNSRFLTLLLMTFHPLKMTNCRDLNLFWWYKYLCSVRQSACSSFEMKWRSVDFSFLFTEIDDCDWTDNCAATLFCQMMTWVQPLYSYSSLNIFLNANSVDQWIELFWSNNLLKNKIQSACLLYSSYSKLKAET
jgi:hypothetical protein